MTKLANIAEFFQLIGLIEKLLRHCKLVCGFEFMPAKQDDVLDPIIQFSGQFYGLVFDD